MDGDLIVALVAAASAVTSAIASVIAGFHASRAERLAKRDYLDVLLKMVGAQRKTHGEKSE